MRSVPLYNEEMLVRYEQIIAEAEEERAKRPRAKLFGARISEDLGETWELKSLCAECISAKNFEPPTLVQNVGTSGTQTCDFCSAINEMYGD